MFFLLGGMAYWGFVTTANGAVAPYLARSFGLGDDQIAWAFGWIALGAAGSFALSRNVDRLGRRRMLLVCLMSLPVTSALTSLAPQLVLYVLLQIASASLAGGLLAAIVVMVAEELPPAERARGQGLAGTAGALGTGAAFIAAPLAGELFGSWRWVWAAAVLPGLLLMATRGCLPESGLWREAVARGETTRAKDLFSRRYRVRTIGLLLTSALGGMAFAAGHSWLFYYPVRSLGVAPPAATGLILVAGGIGLAGFWIGGRLSDRWGRRATFAAMSVIGSGGYLVYFLLPLERPLWVIGGLGAALALANVASSASDVALRCSMTESLPTRLRGSLQGGFAACTSVARIASGICIAALTSEVGGVGPAVAFVVALSMLGIPAFLALVPETAGLRLDALRPGAEREPPAPAEGKLGMS